MNRSSFHFSPTPSVRVYGTHLAADATTREAIEDALTSATASDFRAKLWKTINFRVALAVGYVFAERKKSRSSIDRLKRQKEGHDACAYGLGPLEQGILKRIFGLSPTTCGVVPVGLTPRQTSDLLVICWSCHLFLSGLADNFEAIVLLPGTFGMCFVFVLFLRSLRSRGVEDFFRKRGRDFPKNPSKTKKICPKKINFRF